MFSKIHGRFTWRSGKAGMILAVAVCAAGMAVGGGGKILLAQLTGPNPTSNLEAIPCPYIAGTCTATYPCIPLAFSGTVEVNYTGGSVPGPSATDGCGDEPTPLGDVPCGAGRSVACSQQ